MGLNLDTLPMSMIFGTVIWDLWVRPFWPWDIRGRRKKFTLKTRKRGW